MPQDTALHKAAYKGEVDSCRECIEQGIDVNVPGAGSRTPLHRAVGEDNAECCHFLISKGAKVNFPDGSGRTPMHWAAISGALSCGRILQENGAEFTLKTKSGMTPLHMAAENGRLAFVEWLLTHPQVIESKDEEDRDGKSAGILAKEKKHMEIANLLIPPNGGCCIIS